jgi:hypothetical protein
MREIQKIMKTSPAKQLIRGSEGSFGADMPTQTCPESEGLITIME